MSPVSAPGKPRPVTPVAILASKLAELAGALAQIDGLDGGLVQSAREAAVLAGGLDPYLERHTTPQSAALKQLSEATASHDWNSSSATTGLEQEMLSGHVEGQLLKMLVGLARAKKVLEIGMFTGYSTLAIAEALPADGRIIACEVDPEVAAFAKQQFARSPEGAKIDVRIGPALATLSELAQSSAVFDFVFIDADKSGYLDYLSTILETDLLAAGALICVDNTLLQGQPWSALEPTPNGAAIAAFNQAVADDPRVEQVLVPLRDGLTLIRRTEGSQA
ncbi:MAG: class I SAM-dependent methyltransferase [Antricoccus sp.]